MTRPNVEVGEFQQFINGYEAAELSGPAVDRCVGILGTRPPFRDPNEADKLDFDTYYAARRMATTASGTMEVVAAAFETDRSIDSIVFSRTGALAVRGVEQHERVTDFISYLDGGNHVVNCIARVAYIG